MITFEHEIKQRSGVGAQLPEEVRNLAQALMVRHGSVLVSREKNGLHLNMACPECLSREGHLELTKRHLAVNADKNLNTGKWEHANSSEGVRDRVGLCMKCGQKYTVSKLLAWQTLEARGIHLGKVGKVSFVDNTAWLIQDRKGNVIPGGPGPPEAMRDGGGDAVVPIISLPPDHPAAAYLLQRGYDLQSLWEQFRCSYCVKEWAMDDASGRYYRRMPEGFFDSPQGRIIFFADVQGVQVSWQARIIERTFEQDGGTYKEFWNGHRNEWVTMEFFNTEEGKFRPLPVYAAGPRVWSPSKYRTANGTARNEVLFGLDAAVRWNQQFRPNRMPVCFPVEGPLDAGRIMAPGVAAIGKHFSDAQIDLMAKFFTHAVLVPDNDDAGQKTVKDTMMRMARKLDSHTWNLPSRMDAMNLTIKDVGDMPPPIVMAMKQQWLNQF